MSIETEEWRLEMDIRFVFKGEDERVTCTKCNGTKLIGGHAFSNEEPIPCWLCHETGLMKKQPKTLSPFIPVEIIEHMDKAWDEFFKAHSYRVKEPT